MNLFDEAPSAIENSEGGEKISAPAPYAWREILAYLSRRRTPNLERIDADRYTRQTASSDVTVTYSVESTQLNISTTGETPRVRRLFGLDHDAKVAARIFTGCPLLGPRVVQLPGLRIPGCWEPFELCLRVILGQQVTVAAASTLMGRLGAICPGYYAPEIAKADLTQLGVPGSRARTIQALAQAVSGGDLLFESQPWEEIARVLRRIPGIGPWTVSYLAIRLGREADAFPESDLGLLRGAGVSSPKELLRIAERWRPYRSYAAMHLWIQPQLPDSGTRQSGVA